MAKFKAPPRQKSSTSPPPETKIEGAQKTSFEAGKLPTELWGFKKPSLRYVDFDDSLGSRSTISQTLTATTGNENALDALFHRLLSQKGLANLWPQIVLGQASRTNARGTIEKFLKRFAEDLEHLVTKTDDIDNEKTRRIILLSNKFVMKHRAKVASRICQAYETQETSSDADTDIEDIGVLAIDDTTDHSDEHFAFSIAEEFIFGTEPIRYLEVNLATFLRQRQGRRLSSFWTNLCSYRSSASSIVQSLCRASAPAGKRRVKWTCICGCQIMDDYAIKHEGAFGAFENGLKQYNRVTQTYRGDHDANQSGVETRQSWQRIDTTTIFQWFLGPFTKTRSQSLPNYRTDDTDSSSSRLGSCARSARATQAHHNFVLLCVPYLRWGLRLHNSEVCKINSDQQFFKLLRQCYSDHRVGNDRGVLRKFRKVRALQFVKFEVFRNKLVDVRACPSMPIPGSDYAYDPVDAIPPIGSNMLMHLFENPEHADVTLFLYNRFPKKLRAQLEACPLNKSSTGWGVEFVEGADWYAVFASACLGSLLCLVFGVAWAVARGDVQGGFGIASFLLTFVVFCSGSLFYVM